jgi:hypothetical protein
VLECTSRARAFRSRFFLIATYLFGGYSLLNFFDGQCYVATLPLLGSDRASGEYWTQLGNLLLDRGSFDQVVLAPAAIRARPLSRGQETLIGEPMSRDVIPTKHRHAPTHPFSSSSPAILLRDYAKRKLGLKAHESLSIAITAWPAHSNPERCWGQDCLCSGIVLDVIAANCLISQPRKGGRVV